jgi:hypothetical protein
MTPDPRESRVGLEQVLEQCGSLVVRWYTVVSHRCQSNW